MRKLFIWVVVIIGLISCKENTYFSDNVIPIKTFKVKERLHAEIFISNEYGIYNIIALKDYFIATSVKRDHFFYIYDTKGDSIGCFGTKGQGPNELINCLLNGIDYDNNRIWINDVSKSKLFEIDILKSIENKECYFNSAIENISRSLNACYVDNNLLIAEKQTSNNYELVWIDLQLNEIKRNETLYFPVNDPSTFYYSIWRIKPDKTQMVSAMYQINLLNFLNLSSRERFSLSIFNPPPDRGNIIDIHSELPKWYYYADLIVTDRYIYALYINQAYREAFEVEKEQEIHVFNWKGEAIYQYIIPEYVMHIAVDEERATIYGLGVNEIIYKYKIFNE
jgi:hypothetical protein